jgi:hypothetical protein
LLPCRLDTGKDGRITEQEFIAGKAAIEKVIHTNLINLVHDTEEAKEFHRASAEIRGRLDVFYVTASGFSCSS